MPFESLSNTLSTKPRVLAGPLLRKVEPNSVTVWLALRVGATVMLEVLGADGPFEGERHTVAVGRLIHGSCRIPKGDGEDMLPLVGQLISQTAQTPLQRPHQLLLMGDQIHADDVAASMLVMLTDASDVLLGWQEVLPVPSYWGINTANKFPPFLRRRLLEQLEPSGFTSEDLDSHLLALGEYICKYLFVWSDVLWDVIPSVADVVARMNLPPAVRAPREAIEERIKPLTLFRDGVADHGGLAEVRRSSRTSRAT